MDNWSVRVAALGNVGRETDSNWQQFEEAVRQGIELAASIQASSAAEIIPFILTCLSSERARLCASTCDFVQAICAKQGCKAEALVGEAILYGCLRVVGRTSSKFISQKGYETCLAIVRATGGSLRICVDRLIGCGAGEAGKASARVRQVIAHCCLEALGIWKERGIEAMQITREKQQLIANYLAREVQAPSPEVRDLCKKAYALFCALFSHEVAVGMIAAQVPAKVLNKTLVPAASASATPPRNSSRQEAAHAGKKRVSSVVQFLRSPAGKEVSKRMHENKDKFVPLEQEKTNVKGLLDSLKALEQSKALLSTAQKPKCSISALQVPNPFRNAPNPKLTLLNSTPLRQNSCNAPPPQPPPTVPTPVNPLPHTLHWSEALRKATDFQKTLHLLTDPDWESRQAGCSQAASLLAAIPPIPDSQKTKLITQLITGSLSDSHFKVVQTALEVLATVAIVERRKVTADILIPKLLAIQTNPTFKLKSAITEVAFGILVQTIAEAPDLSMIICLLIAMPTGKAKCLFGKALVQAFDQCTFDEAAIALCMPKIDRGLLTTLEEDIVKRLLSIIRVKYAACWFEWIERFRNKALVLTLFPMYEIDRCRWLKSQLHTADEVNPFESAPSSSRENHVNAISSQMKSFSPFKPVANAQYHPIDDEVSFLA